MDETVSADDADRNVSLLLRGVRDGRSYVVTRHGRPVARIVTADGESQPVARARAMLLSRLEDQPAIVAPDWTREELYENER